MGKNRCQGVKKNGERCSRKVDGDYCYQHQPEESEIDEMTIDDLKEELTERQKAFADHYITTLNATESARKAGYSENTARQTGSENLSKPVIRRYIQKRLEQKEEERIASQDEVLEYLTAVMRGEEKEKLSKITKSGLKVKMETEPEINERTKAAKLLGKRYAMFKEVKDVNHNIDPIKAILEADRELSSEDE